jgi:hypothetical protein
VAVAKQGGPTSWAGPAVAVTPPPFRDYDPHAGDLWAMEIRAEPGVHAATPAGWTYLDGRPVMVDGRVLEATWWWRRIPSAFEPLPTVHFSRHGFAEVGVVAYRLPLDQDVRTQFPTIAKEITSE